MHFVLKSHQDVDQFQTQTLCVQLPVLLHGEWKSEISTRLFDHVRITIHKGVTQMFTTLLREHHFLVGASCLNSVDPQQGGMVRFPLKDILNLWLRTLKVPVPQNLLTHLFETGHSLHFQIQFAPLTSLFHSEIPLKVMPAVKYGIVSDSIASLHERSANSEPHFCAWPHPTPSRAEEPLRV